MRRHKESVMKPTRCSGSLKMGVQAEQLFKYSLVSSIKRVQLSVDTAIKLAHLEDI